MNRKLQTTIRTLMILLLVFVEAAVAADYVIDWYTIDGGGAGVSDASTGGSYTLSGTIGQPDARNHPEAMTGGSYKLTGGFWVIPECPALPCDYDGDCDVDQDDLDLFEVCASGPDIPVIPGCEDRDFDNDADSDQSDFGILQRCLSGPVELADPTCAD